LPRLTDSAWEDMRVEKGREKVAHQKVRGSKQAAEGKGDYLSSKSGKNKRGDSKGPKGLKSASRESERDR